MNSYAVHPVASKCHAGRRRITLAAGMAWAGLLACAGRPARAAEGLRLGINAGVSFAETEDQQRRRYAPLLDTLGRAVGQRLDFGAVYSDRVARAVQSGDHDLLLVHTHAALAAERDANWRVLAFSEDRKDNTVQFFVHPDSTIRDLAGLAGVEIGAPGSQSWATATARSVLRTLAPGREPRFRVTRLQDVVPFMVHLRTVPAGVCRSNAVVAESVGAGRVRVVHVAPPQPLYALVAAPGLPEPLVERIAQQLPQLPAAVFDGTPLKGLGGGAATAQRMRSFYLA